MTGEKVPGKGGKEGKEVPLYEKRWKTPNARVMQPRNRREAMYMSVVTFVCVTRIESKRVNGEENRRNGIVQIGTGALRVRDSRWLRRGFSSTLDLDSGG